MKTELGAEFDKKDTGNGTDADWIYDAEEASVTTIGVDWRKIIERDEMSHETWHHTDRITWKETFVIV